AFGVIGYALLIHVRAFDAAGHRVRNLFLDGFFFRSASLVGFLLADDGAFLEGEARRFSRAGLTGGVYIRAADGSLRRIRILFDFGVRNLLANRDRLFLVHGFAHVGGARHLLANRPGLAHISRARLVRLFASVQAEVTALVVGLASARIIAALARNP